MSTLLNKPIYLKCQPEVGRWSKNAKIMSHSFWMIPRYRLRKCSYTYVCKQLHNIYEFDLSCPYGIVICETDAVTAIGAQVEIAKNVIHQNSSTIFKRFDWLRRNDERTNLTNHEIKLNIHNPILAALKTNLENSLNNIEYNQVSLKKEKSKINKKNWSYGSQGDISIR